MAIVLLGEGDFSFAAAFNGTVYATTYESEELTLQTYPGLGPRLKKLRDAGSVVLFGMDAMTLDTDKRLPKAKLYRWNCPCPGDGGTMQKVLERFFGAAKTTLIDGGVVEILYTKGQFDTVMKDLCLAARAQNFSLPSGRAYDPVGGYVAKYCDSSEPLDMRGATIWSVQYRGENATEHLYPALPMDLLKSVVVEGEAEEWSQPKIGDEVSIRLRKGAKPLTQLENASLEPMSKKGKHTLDAVTHILGRSDLPHGLVQGITTMRTGEAASFMPPGESEGFQIELVCLTKREDLFGDGSAIKTVLQHGGQWEWMPPEDGYEVSLAVRILSLSGEVLENMPELTYVVGSTFPGCCGRLTEAIDRALLGMRRKERASIRCIGSLNLKDRQLEGAIAEVTLHDWRMVVDASPDGDKSIMAKLRRCERTWRTPPPDMLVEVVVDSVTDGSDALSGFVARTLENVTVNDAELCDGLRRVLEKMKLGEHAVVETSRPELFVDKRLNIFPRDAKFLVLNVKLMAPIGAPTGTAKRIY